MSEERTSLEARRQELTDSLKLDVPMFDAELVDLARALDQLRSARGKDESAAGKVDRLNQRHAKLLTDLADILDRHGEARPTDAATAMARLNKLAGRNTRLVQAISDEQQAAGQHEEVSGDREAALRSSSQIYSEAALDDGDLHGADGTCRITATLSRPEKQENESQWPNRTRPERAGKKRRSRPRATRQAVARTAAWRVV